MRRYFYRLLLVLTLITLHDLNIFAQVGYYDSINVANPTFVTDLKERIRRNYTKVSYDQFDETNVANYASRDTSGGKRAVTCVYSGFIQVYTPPFAWTPTTSMSREHTWCHSWMPTYSSTSGNEYSDQHHLFPTHQNGANGVRSNHPLGIVATVTSSFLEGKYGQDANMNNVYEPRDAHKGDAARAILYMALRYDGVNGNSWNFNWLNSVRLPFLNEAPQDINTLIQWHQNDPPDAWEIGRNDYIYSIQNNRNPFIDHPEYVNYIDFNDMTYNPGGGSIADEPTNQVTNFQAELISTLSIRLTWSDAVEGSQDPSGYVLFISNSEISAPTDGVTYSDDLNLSDNIGRVNITHPSAGEYTFSDLNPNTAYNFKIFSFKGSGTQINYKIDGSIPSAVCTTGTPTLATEPTNYPTNFSSSNISHSSITINWSDAIAGSQVPSGYLLVASAGTITSPTDAITYNDDTDLSDGNAHVNIEYSASNSYVFNSLTPNTNYTFKIFSYNNISGSINYKTDDSPPELSASTLDAKGTENLSAGDIVIIGFNMSDPDEFAFLPLINIAGGTQIKFTDNGWLSSGAFRTGEGTKIWTAPAEGVSKGTIVNFNNTSFDIGITGSSFSFAISTEGDQILAHTEINSSINFLYAVNNSGTTWQVDATSSNTSALPSGLINGETAVALTKNNNGVYSGGYSFTPEELLLNVSNPANWTMSSTRLTMPSGNVPLPVELTNFSISPKGNSALLSWSTSNEVNNYGFYVERTSNKANSFWENVGFILGSGYSNSPQSYYFLDSSISSGKYYYRLKQVDNDGQYAYSPIVHFDNIDKPKNYALFQNYPNPFNPSTRIRYSIPQDGFVTLKIYNSLGEEIKTIVNQSQNSGQYEVDLNASNLAGGIYFYELRCNDFIQVRKLVVIK